MCDIAQWIMVLVTKPGDLILILKTHMVEGKEGTLSCCLLTSTGNYVTGTNIPLKIGKQKPIKMYLNLLKKKEKVKALFKVG